jgi:inner membrane transporter RhtA
VGAARASGVVLLGADTSSGIPLSGLAFALLAGLFWAAYILASARVGRLLPGLDGLAVALAVAALLVLPYGAAGASAVLDEPVLLLGGLAIAVLSSVCRTAWRWWRCGGCRRGCSASS